MTRLIIGSVVLTLAAGAAMLAASRQDQTTVRPGELTTGYTFINNRGSKQAIPVVVHEIETSAPVRVHSSRQVWEYKTVAIAAGDDAARVLTAHGVDGWETTGLQVTDGSRLLVLLKRPADK